MQKLFLTVTSLLLLSVASVNSQDLTFARSLIDTLSSSAMEGRGYVNEGDRKAALFLKGVMETNGLRPFRNGYLQEYTFPMNNLPGNMKVSLDGKKLEPGSDFVVWAATPSIQGSFPIQILQEKDLADANKLKRRTANTGGKFILIDRSAIKDKAVNRIVDSLRFTNFPGAKGIILVVDRKLSWSVMAGTGQKFWPVIEVAKSALPKTPKSISLDIESRYNPEHRACNVLAYVPGTIQPDTFLVFTAHFDHLGRMGSEVFFPGANDNASGTAMVCDLAKYYAAAKPYYSMAFFLLSGEEAGLFGAEYCAANLPVEASRIKFLVNLDMVGTGSEGITMVNGTIFTEGFRRMEKINADNEYLLTVKQRGESCNSDHCPFYKKGIPAVFIYAMGKDAGPYHNPDDTSKNLGLSEYADIFRLMVDFMNSFKPN